MTIKEVTDYLEELSPLAYAEDFDNVGLLVGDAKTKVSGILVSLDTLETTVEEAIEKNCNLIISFHPIIFKGIKKINGTDYVQRVVIKAIKNNIAIYAIHTALDNSVKGVSAKMGTVIGLKNCQVLIPQIGNIKKLTTYVPDSYAENLRNAIFTAGAGSIGNYDSCSFSVNGTGTYRGNEDSKPTIGEKGQLHFEPETMISVIFEKHVQKKVLQALFENHPYEEVAYEIISLENKHQNIGMGMVGELEYATDPIAFLQNIKHKFNLKALRHSALSETKIKRVAVLGGSGSFAISAAKNAGADIFLTADLKYHDFYQAENQIVLVDIGHYESEQFTKNLLVDYLKKKITNFAIILSENNTNPINYL